MSTRASMVPLGTATGDGKEGKAGAPGTAGGDGSPDATQPAAVVDCALTADPDDPGHLPPQGLLRHRLGAFLILAAAAGWTGAYLWVRWPEMRDGAMPGLWISWLGEWSIPALLLVIVWYLALRSGRGEQARFADAAASLRQQAAELEDRLAVVNRELSLAREFLAAQSRDLESLGRMAAERLSRHGEQLQTLVALNGNRIEHIGQVGEAAIANMERLRDQLPVLASAARDMTSQIGHAGQTAQIQVQALAEGLARLESFGEAGEHHVGRITARIMETLEVFERQATELADIASTRFTDLQRQCEELRGQMLKQDHDALEAMERRTEQLTAFIERRNQQLREIEERALAGLRQRVEAMVEQSDRMLQQMVQQRNEASDTVKAAIEALENRLVEAIGKVSAIDEAAIGNARRRLMALSQEANRIDETIRQSAQAFENEWQQRRLRSDEIEAQALADLEARLGKLDSEVAAREQRQLERLAAMAERESELTGRLQAIEAELAALDQQLGRAREAIGTGADQLATQLAHSQALIEQNLNALARLSDAGGHVLELVRAGAQTADGPLAEAIGRANERLEQCRAQGRALTELVSEAAGHGSALCAQVQQAQSGSSAIAASLAEIGQQLDALAKQTAGMAEQTRTELQRAVDQLSMTSANVLQNLREGQAEALRELAEEIAGKSSTAIAASLETRTGETLTMLNEATGRALEAGREGARALRDQLAMINELIGNLEQRVAQARERAQEQTDDDFSRRMALITEALNSGAIDISKAFETEVADTQWANYLRGDRGIFTRRAVRLLDKQDQRAILGLYEADGEFREAVNRYIADFETMLRNILATRDGHALAVTLLSADAGKLYVCLAQAIERLRD